ncbi:MAG: hypothetical protein LBQ08_05040 [Holosporaceae bacterium]|jgi:hypothetical protein|nr:hypothetical protein [Holosporaceae bacterium]
MEGSIKRVVEERKEHIEVEKKRYEKMCKIFGTFNTQKMFLRHGLKFVKELNRGMSNELFADILREITPAVENGWLDEEVENEIAQLKIYTATKVIKEEAEKEIKRAQEESREYPDDIATRVSMVLSFLYAYMPHSKASDEERERILRLVLEKIQRDKKEKGL